jgi:hypothetical protein
VISPGDGAISASQIDPDLCIAFGLAALERPRQIVEALRLHAEYLRAGTGLLHRQRNATGKPTARSRHQHRLWHSAQRLRLLHQLQPGRALTGHHIGIVERVHERRPALLANAQRDGVAILRLPIVSDHLAAEGARARDLELGRIRGHHDSRLQPEQCRRRGHALRMIARRARHHAAGISLAVHLRDLVEGTPKLERADALQILAFDQDAPAGTCVERRMLDQRRRNQVRLEALARGQHIVVGRQADGHMRNSRCTPRTGTPRRRPPSSSRRPNHIDRYFSGGGGGSSPSLIFKPTDRISTLDSTSATSNPPSVRRILLSSTKMCEYAKSTAIFSDHL